MALESHRVSDYSTFLCGQFHAQVASRTTQNLPRVIIFTEAKLIPLSYYDYKGRVKITKHQITSSSTGISAY